MQCFAIFSTLTLKAYRINVRFRVYLSLPNTSLLGCSSTIEKMFNLREKDIYSLLKEYSVLAISSISKLKIHIFNLKMYVFRLKTHIYNLKIKFKTLSFTHPIPPKYPLSHRNIWYSRKLLHNLCSTKSTTLFML